ncbi:MAG: hypothetical protein HZB67_05625 [Candidatus Aenigmarchaeota archaeon]|nr:hypothetical protein [Candidatus Aenigmarchaeota archaeon]
MDDYFKEAKKSLEEKIPDFDSAEFKKMGDKIRKQLQKKENDLLITIRRLKILVLGDWHTIEKKQRLENIKNILLTNGLYAETIDKYYDMNMKGGLSPSQILETCCINHQLIVFLDGDGKGTVTEQNYLSANYVFQGKILFFIEEPKFNKLKDDPSQYLNNFPSIITYRESELLDRILAFSRLRIYRLAGIIKTQSASRKGLKNPNYSPWKSRLKRQ